MTLVWGHKGTKKRGKIKDTEITELSKRVKKMLNYKITSFLAVSNFKAIKSSRVNPHNEEPP